MVFQAVTERGSNLRGGGGGITFDKNIYIYASEHIHLVSEINLQNNNSLMCMLSRI